MSWVFLNADTQNVGATQHLSGHEFSSLLVQTGTTRLTEVWALAQGHTAMRALCGVRSTWDTTFLSLTRWTQWEGSGKG